MARILIGLSLLLLATATHSAPRDPSRDLRPYGDRIVATGHAQAKLDTVYLLGGPGRQDGKFQDDANPALPDAEGWIGVDLTTSQFSHWQDSAFHSPTGTQAAWCGILLQPCSPGDPPEGYADNWKENLVWSGVVADPGLPTDVTVTLSASWDTEWGFDFLHLQVWRHGAQAWETVASWTGTGTEIGAVHGFTAAPEDLDAGRVRWRLRGESDGAWSDGDCAWPTAAGLCQVDDVSVTGTNGLPATFDDFADGIDASAFVREYDQGVGDFAQVWPGLVTLDPCDRNRSPRFAFIDDGRVVPCTDGSPGQTWTYGPGGFGVNLTGGCLGPDAHLHNQIWSPPILWQDAQGQPLSASYGAAILEYDVYVHLPLSNGLLYEWVVRSSRGGDLLWGPWAWNGSAYYSYPDGARVIRRSHRLDPYLDPERTAVQIAFGTMDLGWIWGYAGTDPTPAPYFDNVALKAFPIAGPIISAGESSLAQDSFPAIGTLDFADLGRNDVRFDMAQDVGAAQVVPGDSIVVIVEPSGTGSTLSRPPRLHYTIRANPLFDAYRAHPLTGFADGDSLIDSFGFRNAFRFDLPDEDLLYPGDKLHYYISAEQSGPFAGTTTLPESLAGFGVFPGDPGWAPGAWPELFQVDALPTLFSGTPGDQPSLLLWRDGGSEQGIMEWIHALGAVSNSLSAWDTYITNSPAGGVGNGLGGRATLTQIAGYDIILYDAGAESLHTLVTAVDPQDRSDDVALLDAWLESGGKLVLCGDGVVSDLTANGGAAGAAFVAERLGVSAAAADIQELLPGPRNPLLVPDGGNGPAFDHRLFGRNVCPGLRSFDAVAADAGAVRFYHWREEGASPYAAVAYHATATGRAYTVTLGFDALCSIDPEDDWGMGPVPARTVLLGEMLQSFGFFGGDAWTPVPETPRTVRVSAVPNPFNPEVELRFTAASASRAVVEVFDVRGARVRTLLDARVDAGPHTATWDGRDDGGAARASGVYFARVRVGEETRVEKLALIR